MVDSYIMLRAAAAFNDAGAHVVMFWFPLGVIAHSESVDRVCVRACALLIINHTWSTGVWKPTSICILRSLSASWLIPSAMRCIFVWKTRNLIVLKCIPRRPLASLLQHRRSIKNGWPTGQQFWPLANLQIRPNEFKLQESGAQRALFPNSAIVRVV
jgi:hypothetical protein